MTDLKSGIYKIVNLIDKKFYIGSAKDLKKRWSVHCSCLNKNKHPNQHLQNVWNKNGEQNFKFKIILYCELKNLLFYEQLCIDRSHCYKSEIGYNICKIAGNTTGRKISDLTRQKIKAKRKFQIMLPWTEKRTEKMKQKMSGERNPMFGKRSAMFGVKMSTETKIKMRNQKKTTMRPILRIDIITRRNKRIFM